MSAPVDPKSACCSLPPVQAEYTNKGSYKTIEDLNTYVTGPSDAKTLIISVYDIVSPRRSYFVARSHRHPLECELTFHPFLCDVPSVILVWPDRPGPPGSGPHLGRDWSSGLDAWYACPIFIRSDSPCETCG
jgi:hypothetical protein